MDEILKMLDEKLEYISHEIVLDTIYINAVSNLAGVECPKCKKYLLEFMHIMKKLFKTFQFKGKKLKLFLETEKCYV